MSSSGSSGRDGPGSRVGGGDKIERGDCGAQRSGLGTKFAVAAQLTCLLEGDESVVVALISRHRSLLPVGNPRKSQKI